MNARELTILGTQMARDASAKCSAEEFDELVTKARSGDFARMLESMSGNKLPDVEHGQLVQILTSAQSTLMNYRSQVERYKNCKHHLDESITKASPEALKIAKLIGVI